MSESFKVKSSFIFNFFYKKIFFVLKYHQIASSLEPNFSVFIQQRLLSKRIDFWINYL
jgi:hypothetical protein